MPAPANDNFAAAIALTAGGGTLTISTTDATSETGEQDASFSGQSIWFTWTPAAGAVRVRVPSQAEGAVYMQVYAYTGTALGSLTAVHGGTSGDENFKAEWIADGTTTYRIRVASPSNGTGGTMTYGPYTKPANDDIADAIDLAETGGSVTFDNTLAGVQPGERPVGNGYSLWWKVTPTTAQVLEFDVLASPAAGTMFASLLLYDAADLALPAAPDVSVPRLAVDTAGRLVSNVEAGHTYYLRVDANTPHTDNVLTWGPVTPPANDAFDGAIALTPATGGSLPFDNTDATRQATDNEWNWTGNGTLWYSYTTDVPGDVTIHTETSPDDDTYLAVFVDDGLVPTASDTPLVDNDTGPPPDYPDAASVTFTAAAGVLYKVQLSAYAILPAGTLTWTGPSAPDSIGMGEASVAVDYRYEVVDNTGVPLADLPLTVSDFSDVLSGVGILNATLPLTHASARRGLIDPPGRELVVTRNGQVVWNGPITYVRRSKRDQTVTIRASQLPWYLYNTRLEVSKSYTATDVFDIVRDLVTYATGKTGGSRFAFTVSTGLAGITKTIDYDGAYRLSVGQIIQDLASDPAQGFDFRLDVFGSSARDLTRKLTLGAPAIGTTVLAHKLEPGAGMYDLVEELDIERGGNRVHVLPGIGATLTRENTSSLTAGDPLIEQVLNRPDLDSAKPPASGLADEFRCLAQPPVRVFTAAYIPRAAVPYSWCDLGDLIGLFDEDMQINATRRVLVRTTRPPGADTPETVDLTLNLPLDDLGT